MLRNLITSLFIIISLTLSSCATTATNLQSYVSASKGYEFLYPNGWIQVDVKNASEGVDVVFRDLIERSENLSVIISDIPKDKSLTDLGTPTEVGYRFFKAVHNDTNSNRETELINAESHEVNGQTYYTLEYQVKLPNNEERHDLASVAVSDGKLYTFNLSTLEKRWNTVKNLFQVAANSFTVY